MQLATYYPGSIEPGLKCYRSTAEMKALIYNDPRIVTDLVPAADEYQIGVFTWTVVPNTDTATMIAYNVPRIDCPNWDGSGTHPVFSGMDLSDVNPPTLTQWAFKATTCGYVTADKQYGEVVECQTILTDGTGDHVVKSWNVGNYPAGSSYAREVIMTSYVTGPISTTSGSSGGATFFFECAYAGREGSAGALYAAEIANANKQFGVGSVYTWPGSDGEWYVPDATITGHIGISDKVRAIQTMDPLAMARLAITESTDAEKSEYINI